MRIIVLAALAAAVAATAGAADKPVPDIAAGPGCLGVTAEICVRWLEATMRLNEGLIPGQMAGRHAVDVNGRPLGGGMVTLSGMLPGHAQTMVVLVHLHPDDTVASIESTLLGDLITATTEQGYDATAVYDMVSRILGRRCPQLTRLGLYRFIENSVLPRIVKTQQDPAGEGVSGLHRVILRAAEVPNPTCGMRFTYTAFLERRHSAPTRAAKKIEANWTIEVK